MKLMSIITELMILQPLDLAMLRAYGQSIVDEIESGPYHMILVVSQSGEYQVGLTSFEKNFTKPEHQSDIDKTSDNRKELKQHFQVMMNKIKEWLIKHGTLTIGSFNTRKVKKYYSLLKSAGFNCDNLTMTSTWGRFRVTENLPNF